VIETEERAPRQRPEVLVGVLVLLVCVIGGALVAGLERVGLLSAVFLAPAGLLGCLALFVWPHLGLLVAMFFAVDVLFLGELLDIRVLGGGIELKDLVFALMCGLIWVRGSLDRRYRPRVTLMSKGVSLFLVGALVSAVWAQARGVPLLDTLQGLRPLFYYVMFYLVCGALRDRRQERTVLRGLLIIAALAAAVSIAQYVVGPNLVITGGRIEVGAATSGATRVVLPGTEFVNIMFLFAVCLAVFAPRGRTRLVYIALAGLFGLAVLLSFSRNLWLADFLVLVLLLGLVERRRRGQIVAAALVALIVLALGVLLLGSLPAASSAGASLAEALGNRVTEIMGGNITQLATIDGRLGEVILAWEHIRTSPLLGIGLGAAYYGASDSPWSPGSIQRHPYLVRYVHNGYVSIALKMGIPVLCLYLGIFVLFVAQSLRVFRKADEWQDRAVASAITLSCVGLLITDMIHPAFLSTSGAATIGLLWGLGEVMRLRLRDADVVGASS